MTPAADPPPTPTGAERGQDLFILVQLALVITVSFVVFIAGQSDSRSIFHTTLLLGAALVVIAVAGTLLQQRGIDRRWLLLLILLDVGIIAGLRGSLYDQQPRASFIILIPVLYLSYRFGWPGAWFAVASTWFVAIFPYVAGEQSPATSAQWGTELLPPAIITIVAFVVLVAAKRSLAQRNDLVRAYEDLRLSVASGIHSAEALRISVADGIDGAEKLRVSVAEGVGSAEALRVSVADGIDGAEALRVSVAEGVDSAEALRISVARGLDGAEELRVSKALNVEGAEALRVSVAEGADSAEALRVSVAEGVDSAEALRVSVAEGVDSAEALRVSVAEGVDSAEALRISVAQGLDGAEELRLSKALNVEGAEALRASVAEGVDSAEALRVSVAEGVDSAEALRVSVALGLVGAEKLRVSTALNLDSAEALRVSVADGLDGAEALRVSVAQGLDAASTALAVVDTVDAGITFYDSRGVVMLTNDTARALAVSAGGSTATPAQGLHVFEDDRTTPISALDQIFGRAARGELVTRKTYWVGTGDDQRAIMGTSQYVRRASGELIGTVVATHDVTPLVEAIRSRDEFLTTVSHELRTPLTSVIGYLELIEDTLDIAVAGIEHEFGIVQRNSQRLLGLINDLLTTAEGQASLERRPFDLSELAENSVNTIRAAAATAGISILSPHLLPVIAEVDAHRIGDVFDKLLSNAVKFNRPGGEVLVTVDGTDSEAVIRIADTGIGISASDQDHIFERFFRSSTARSGAVAGTGLGLSTAKIIVDAHHGTITTSSVIGEGTTIVVRLPLVVARASAD